MHFNACILTMCLLFLTGCVEAIPEKIIMDRYGPADLVSEAAGDQVRFYLWDQPPEDAWRSETTIWYYIDEDMAITANQDVVKLRAADFPSIRPEIHEIYRQLVAERDAAAIQP